MDALRGITVLGIGLTSFLLVAVVVTEVMSNTVEFSVFLGLPAGLLAGALGALVAARILRGSPSTRTVALTAAIAADGYAVLAGFALRYAVAPTRDVLTTPIIGGLSLVVAALVGLAVLLGPGRVVPS